MELPFFIYINLNKDLCTFLLIKWKKYIYKEQVFGVLINVILLVFQSFAMVGTEKTNLTFQTSTHKIVIL